jgi:hypothetical protein
LAEIAAIFTTETCCIVRTVPSGKIVEWFVKCCDQVNGCLGDPTQENCWEKIWNGMGQICLFPSPWVRCDYHVNETSWQWSWFFGIFTLVLGWPNWPHPEWFPPLSTGLPLIEKM